MNKLILITSLMILISSCKVSKINNSARSNEYFKVEIVQDGKIIKNKNGIISLERKPFVFKIELYKTSGIDVSASWGKYYYDYPMDKNIYICNDDSFFEDCRFVSIKTVNQDKFNVDKVLAVGDGDYQWHWFYMPEKEWHRFDEKVEVKNGITYATMSVQNIYDCDLRDSREVTEDKYNYPIDKIGKDIYMVFAASHYESGMELPDELQRQKFILKFK